MNDLPAEQKQVRIACTCGHPDREHSACSGECYLCGCKQYAPVIRGPEQGTWLARAYRRILVWLKVKI